MMIILNETISIKVKKGINIFITEDQKVRDTFLSSFSLWFKTGIEARENVSFEIIENNENLKKNTFEIITVTPTIEDYLKPRPVKNQISKQLEDFVNQKPEVEHELLEVIESLRKLNRKINEEKSLSDYTFELPTSINKEILSILEYKLEISDMMSHQIMQSKVSMIDLQVKLAKKNKLIIFIPFLSLGLITDEIKYLLQQLRNYDAYIIILETDQSIIPAIKKQDNVKLVPNAFHSLNIVDMLEEIIKVYEIAEQEALIHLQMIINQYQLNQELNIELIKDYLENKYVL